MCFILNKQPEKKIAEKDFTIYKLFFKNFLGIKLCSICQDYPYVYGERQPTVELKETRGVIHEGYHGYVEEFINGVTNVWVYSIQMKCIVPQGATYYTNNRGEIVSSDLIIGKEEDII